MQRTKLLLRGKLTQAAFAEHIDMSFKSFEAVLSARRAVSRIAARDILQGLSDVVNSPPFTERDRHFLLRACEALGFGPNGRAAEAVKARYANVAALVKAGVIDRADVPKALEALAYAQLDGRLDESLDAAFEDCRRAALVDLVESDPVYSRLIGFFSDELDVPNDRCGRSPR